MPIVPIRVPTRSPRTSATAAARVEPRARAHRKSVPCATPCLTWTLPTNFTRGVTVWYACNPDPLLYLRRVNTPRCAKRARNGSETATIPNECHDRDSSYDPQRDLVVHGTSPYVKGSFRHCHLWTGTPSHIYDLPLTGIRRITSTTPGAVDSRRTRPSVPLAGLASSPLRSETPPEHVVCRR